MKRGRRGRGYWSRSIESSGSMPPLGGIPLDRLVLALDIPSESSRLASFFDRSLGTPDSGTRDLAIEPVRWVSLRPLEILIIVSTYLGSQGKERIAAIRLFALWARLFWWEPLGHCTGAGFVASRL